MLRCNRKANQRPRRRPVARHPGIYYRPRPGGRVGPPYEISYLDSTGRRRWQVVHGSLADAEARRAELRLRRHRGERIEPTTERFAEYALAWLERQSTRDRTREVHSWALRQHLIPYFGTRRIDQITVDDVAAFIVVLQDKGLRGSTANTALRSLSRILSHAARRGAIPINPCSQLERGERPKLNDTRPHRILSLDEMHAVLANSECMLYRCLLELLFTTGVRIGEALGLAVGDLDIDNCVIRVECQLGRDGTRSPLKTEESRRAIDIPPQLMRRLVALTRERGTHADPEAFVFASRNGSGIERKVAREALKRAVTKAGITAPAPTLHDLRHSHASMLIALDTSIVEIQRRLGHRKPDTTLRIYAHEWKYNAARRSQVGRQLGELFEAARQLEPPERQPLALPPAGGSSQEALNDPTQRLRRKNVSARPVRDAKG
ncbi:MAG: tyrosine-type recombinase/integrase [Acetobacteraceae bacterium]